MESAALGSQNYLPQPTTGYHRLPQATAAFCANSSCWSKMRRATASKPLNKGKLCTFQARESSWSAARHAVPDHAPPANGRWQMESKRRKNFLIIINWHL